MSWKGSESRRWQTWAAWGLAILFASAALGKWLRLADFLQVVKALDLFPGNAAPFLVFLLIGAEMTVAVCLAVPSLRQLGGVLASALLAFFVAIVGYALYHGLFISCGCFAFLRDRSFSVGLLVQDLLLLALALALTRSLLRRESLPA